MKHKWLFTVFYLLIAVALLGIVTVFALDAGSLNWWTVDGGGATSSSTGGSYSLAGSIGQPDAGTSTGGTYALVGGFWGVINTPPNISDITDKSTNENTATGNIAFTIGDAETPAASLTVTATSSNTTLIPNTNITLGGTGTSRTINITPASNQNGISTIMVTVNDGTATASDTFVLTVSTINKNDVDVYIGGAPQGSYLLATSESTRQSYAVNDGPVKITNSDTASIIAAERLTYIVNGVPTSFSEMMGLPAGELDKIYWMPWYNNTGLDTQLRFGNVSGSEAHVRVYIGGDEMPGSPFTLTASGEGQSLRVSFPGVSDGPVQVVSDVPIVAAERLTYIVNGVPTSFTEMMGLPAGQLDKTYWMPWYNNTGLDTQLRIGNVSGSEAHVRVYIGGDEMPGSPFTLAASGEGQSLRVSFPGVSDGPVQVVSDELIVAAERLTYIVNGVPTSFSEMMGLPAGELDKIYWMPWYNNTGLDTQLRFGNVSGSEAHVRVYIGGDEMPGSPFTLTASGEGQSLRVSFPGVSDGPVQVVSDVPIVAAERLTYIVNGVPTSFTEMMGLPAGQLDKTYWMPWYNNTGLDTQLRIGVP